MLNFKKLFGKFLRKQTQKQTEQVFVDSQKCHQVLREQYTVHFNTRTSEVYRERIPLSVSKEAILKLIAVAFSETIPATKLKRHIAMKLGLVREVEWSSGGYVFHIKASIRTADKRKQGYAKSTVHLRMTGRRCFSGSLYRYNGEILDGSIHHFGDISYLRTPLDWVVQVNKQSIPISEAIFGIDLGEWDEFSGRHTDWTSLYEKYPEK